MVAANGELVFAPGETTKEVAVTIIDDELDEYEEQFTVKPSSPVNATFGDDQGVATIVDNDAAPTVSILGSSVAEHAGVAVFTVSLSRPSGKQISVNWHITDGTANAGEDYVSDSGAILFNPGETYATISIAIIDDLIHENLEHYYAFLTNVVHAEIESPGYGVGEIIDNDPIPSLRVSDAVVVEGTWLRQIFAGRADGFLQSDRTAAHQFHVAATAPLSSARLAPLYSQSSADLPG